MARRFTKKSPEPGRYLMAPTFVSDNERTRKLTRVVMIVEDPSPVKGYVLTEETTNGPPIGPREVLLWEAGKRRLREFSKYRFDPA